MFSIDTMHATARHTTTTHYLHSAPASTLTLESLAQQTLQDLLTGLRYFIDGDRLSAFRYVQIHALDKLMQFIERTTDSYKAVALEQQAPVSFAARYPDYAPLLRSMMLGHDDTPHAAANILHFLHEHWPLSHDEEIDVQNLLKRCGWQPL